MQTTRMIRRAALLLTLLLALPLAALCDSTEPAESFSIAERFGIENVSRMRFIDRNRLCVIAAPPDDGNELFEVYFLSLDQETPLQTLRVENQRSIERMEIEGESLRLIFPHKQPSGETELWDVMTVAIGGEPEWRTLTEQEVFTFPLPDGTQITQDEGSLLRFNPKSGAREQLLTGVPYDPEADNAAEILYYYFFASLDEHRFIYWRMGWEMELGYGVYDLRTGKDLLIEKDQGRPCLLYDGKLYTTSAVVNLETLKPRLLHKRLRDLLPDENVPWAISPDGSTLCIGEAVDWSVLNIYSIQSGAWLQEIQLSEEISEPPTYVDADTIAVHFSEWETEAELVEYFDVGSAME